MLQLVASLRAQVRITAHVRSSHYKSSPVTPKRVAMLDNDTLLESVNGGKTYTPVLMLDTPITTMRFAYGARLANGTELEHWVLVASGNLLYGRMAASMQQPLRLVATMYPEYAVHAITLPTNSDPSVAYLLVHAHPPPPPVQGCVRVCALIRLTLCSSSSEAAADSTSSSDDSTESTDTATSSSSTGGADSTVASDSMSSSTGRPWSSSSGSVTHRNRKRITHTEKKEATHSRSKRGREEEDGPEDEEEGGQDWDSKAKPSQPLSPREYSVWRLRTDKMALEDITGDLPLKVEAWNSPFFQAAALIAVSLKVRTMPSDF